MTLISEGPPALPSGTSPVLADTRPLQCAGSCFLISIPVQKPCFSHPTSKMVPLPALCTSSALWQPVYRVSNHTPHSPVSFEFLICLFVSLRMGSRYFIVKSLASVTLYNKWMKLFPFGGGHWYPTYHLKTLPRGAELPLLPLGAAPSLTPTGMGHQHHDTAHHPGSLSALHSSPTSWDPLGT